MTLVLSRTFPSALGQVFIIVPIDSFRHADAGVVFRMSLLSPIEAGCEG